MSGKTSINDDFEEEGPFDAKLSYAQLKTFSSNSSAEFEVLLDETEKTETSNLNPKLASNFFYDDKLLNSLSSGWTSNGPENETQHNTSSDDELEPFERMARNMEDLTNDGGVLKKMIKHGVGPSLTDGSTVRFHYSSFLEYGDEPMDSTHFRNKMTKAKIGYHDVIPGLNIALNSMRLKEEAHFLVKPAYAYGKCGCPPRIPPNATVLFEVRIEDAVDYAAADDVEAGEWSWERHNAATFQERLEAARAYHRKGNSYYSSSNLSRARRCYQRGIWLMEYISLKDEEEETLSFTLQTKLYANLAKVYLDQSQPTKACTQCRLALELSYDMPPAVKAKVYFRYATAKALLNSFNDARKYFLLTQKLKPNCHGIAKRLEELAINQRRYEAQERFMYKKMFAQADSSQGTETLSSVAADSNHGKNAAADQVKTKNAQRRTTIDQGVIITELDEQDSDGNEGSVSGKISLRKTTEQLLHEKMDKCSIDNEISKKSQSQTEYEEEVAKLPRNLKPEFVDIVLAELERLVGTGGRVKQVMFPCNLNVDELAFIAISAADRDCHLEFIHRGNVRYPKVVMGQEET